MKTPKNLHPVPLRRLIHRGECGNHTVVSFPEREACSRNFREGPQGHISRLVMLPRIAREIRALFAKRPGADIEYARSNAGMERGIKTRSQGIQNFLFRQKVPGSGKIGGEIPARDGIIEQSMNVMRYISKSWRWIGGGVFHRLRGLGCGAILIVEIVVKQILRPAMPLGEIIPLQWPERARQQSAVAFRAKAVGFLRVVARFCQRGGVPLTCFAEGIVCRVDDKRLTSPCAGSREELALSNDAKASNPGAII